MSEILIIEICCLITLLHAMASVPTYLAKLSFIPYVHLPTFVLSTFLYYFLVYKYVVTTYLGGLHHSNSSL